MGTGGGVKDGGGGKKSSEDQAALYEEKWLGACEILAGSVGMEW